MNWADYVILAALGLSVAMGLWRGFVGEVLALAVWAVAIWVAWHFGPLVSTTFTAVELPSARILLGYAVCFVAVLIAGVIVGFVMRKLVAGSGLSGTDRLLGAVFGLARGLVLVVLVVLLLGFTPLPRDPWWHGSYLLPTFQQVARQAAARLPADVAQYLDLRGLLLPSASPAALPTQPTANGHKSGSAKPA
ncbi:MAG: CvpA family protein [Proteobacteria bacterium]|nr:CvpA family protein [Pseudomonadota bacterium]